MKGWLERTAEEMVEKMTIEEIKKAAIVGIMATLLMTGQLAKSITKSLNKEGRG